jgi:hypothetical protein
MTGGRGYVAIPVEERPELARKYRAGAGLTDLCVEYGVSYSAIRTALMNYGVRFRSAHTTLRPSKHMAGRKGSRSPSWIGDHANYLARHSRVRASRGRAAEYPCTDCGTTDAPRMEWAQIKGTDGMDPMDYRPLCHNCHEDYDAKLAREQVDEVKALRYFGISTVRLAAMYGVNPSYISMIVSGRRRTTHVPYCEMG